MLTQNKQLAQTFEIEKYGDKAKGLLLLEKHYSSPVRIKTLTIQAVKTYYVVKGGDLLSIPLPSEEKPLIFRSSFLGEDQPGNSGRAHSFVVTNPANMEKTIDQIIQSYPKNCQSQSVIIQHYVRIPNESAGVITFDADADIMRIDSIHGEGCEAVVSGTKPTDLTLYDGHNLLSSACFNKEVLADLYSEMQKLAKDQGSFLIEYVMEEASNELYVLQFKPFRSLEEKPSYIDPEHLSILEQQYQRLSDIQTIVPGNNAVLEQNKVSNFQTIEAAHTAYFIDNVAKHALCIIHEIPTHSMGSHYATNFQAAGITVMYAPSNLMNTLSAQGKNILCSPQQQELFILPAQSVIERKPILLGKLWYLIPEKNNYQTDINVPDNFLGRSITRILRRERQTESNILEQMKKHLSSNNYPIWDSGFKENKNFRSLMFMLYEHNLLLTCFLFFDNRLEKSDINQLTDDMKDEFTHLKILTTSVGLFQSSKTIEAIQQDYIHFEKICNQLNAFLLAPDRFNAKYLNHQVESGQPLTQYVYTVVLLKNYIEYMDKALKHLASNSQRNHPEVFAIFCNALKKFCEPNYKIKNGVGIGLEFSVLEKTVYDGIQALDVAGLDDTMIAKQYECSQLEKDATPKTASELWTKQHGIYTDSFHKALQDFLSKRFNKITDLSKRTRLNPSITDLINFPAATLRKLDKIPPVFFYPRPSERKEHTVMTVQDKLARLFECIYSVLAEGDCIFLKMRFPVWDHGFAMVIPISMNDSIKQKDLKIYYYSEKPFFDSDHHSFSEKNPWCIIANIGDRSDAWRLHIVTKVLEETRILKQISKEKQPFVLKPYQTQLSKKSEPFPQLADSKNKSVEDINKKRRVSDNWHTRTLVGRGDRRNRGALSTSSEPGFPLSTRSDKSNLESDTIIKQNDGSATLTSYSRATWLHMPGFLLPLEKLLKQTKEEYLPYYEERTTDLFSKQSFESHLKALRNLDIPANIPHQIERLLLNIIELQRKESFFRKKKNTTEVSSIHSRMI